ISSLHNSSSIGVYLSFHVKQNKVILNLSYNYIMNNKLDIDKTIHKVTISDYKYDNPDTMRTVFSILLLMFPNARIEAKMSTLGHLITLKQFKCNRIDFNVPTHLKKYI